MVENDPFKHLPHKPFLESYFSSLPPISKLFFSPFTISIDSTIWFPSLPSSIVPSLPTVLPTSIPPFLPPFLCLFLPPSLPSVSHALLRTQGIYPQLTFILYFDCSTAVTRRYGFLSPPSLLLYLPTSPLPDACFSLPFPSLPFFLSLLHLLLVLSPPVLPLIPSSLPHSLP